MSKTIRWGILGPGGISHAFVKELKLAKDAVIQAVGSRSMERAKQFADQYDIQHAYGSYEELAADPEVDIVYVATPHPQHCQNTLLCLRAGKAVLCEKPFTVNARETEEMIVAARENKVFLMEAMWTRYLPTIHKVRSWINEGAIGEIKMLQASFGFKSPWDPAGRLLNKELGGGALLDAGIYTASFASWVFGRQPERIESTAHIGTTGVDEWCTALFDYGDGRMATLHNAVQLNLCTEALITGTEGQIHIPRFLAAKTATLTRHGQAEEVYQDQTEVRGMGHEAEEAMRCLREGLLESPGMPLDESYAIMQTLDKLRAQWGLSFPADR